MEPKDQQDILVEILKKSRGATSDLVRVMEKHASIARQTEGSLIKEAIARTKQIAGLEAVTEKTKSQEVALAALKLRAQDLTDSLLTIHSRRVLEEIEGGNKFITLAKMQWGRFLKISDEAFETLTGLEAEFFGPLEGFALALGAIALVGNELSKVYATSLTTQLSMTSAGGALVGNWRDLTGIQSDLAYKSLTLGMNLGEVNSTMTSLLQNSVLGTAEIGAMAGTFDASTREFQTARIRMTADLADATVNITALGPAFGKSIGQMGEIMTTLRSDLSVPVTDMVTKMGMLASLSGRTGMGTDTLINGLSKLGQSYRFVGVGLDPLARDFLALRLTMEGMGGTVKKLAQDSIQSAKLITDFSDAMEGMPIEQVIGMLQMKNPNLTTTQAITQAYQATPVDRAALMQNMFKGMGVPKNELGALLGLSMFKGQGPEGLQFGNMIARGNFRGNQGLAETKLQTMSDQGKDTVSRLNEMTRNQRLTNEGYLSQILNTLKNIEHWLGGNVMKFIGGSTTSMAPSGSVPTNPFGTYPGSMLSVPSAAR